MYECSVRTTLKVFERFSSTPLNFSACSSYSKDEREIHHDSIYTPWWGEDEIRSAVYFQSVIYLIPIGLLYHIFNW